MDRKKIIILTVVFIIIASFIAYQQGYFNSGHNNNENIKEGINPGNRAPDFTLQTLYGKEISLSSLKGKKVFLNFWASWCGPCRLEMPDLQKLYKNHKNIKVLAVNVKEDKGSVLNFMMANSYNFPVALNKSGKVSDQYVVRGIPTSYVLDEKGIIITRHTGVLDYAKMKELLSIKK